jgi:hypothetical protein
METERKEKPMEENQEVTPELTIDEKIAQAGLTELSATLIKPLLDILGLDTTFYGYVNDVWTTGDNVPLRQELETLHKAIKSAKSEKDGWYDKYRELNQKRDKVEEYLDDNWDSIDEEVRDELCEIFGIEDTVTKTVNIMVKGTIDITAPRGYDWDNIESDINPSVDVSIDNSDLDESGYGWSHDETEIEVD